MSTPTLNPATLTYEDVIAAYTALLKANPGKALYLGGDLFALMDGEALCVTNNREPLKCFDPDYFSDFDSNAWVSDERRWDGDDSPEQTISYIAEPNFVWLDPVLGAAKDLLQHIVFDPEGELSRDEYDNMILRAVDAIDFQEGR